MKNKTKTERNRRDDAAVLLRPRHAQQKSEKQVPRHKAEELIDRIDYDFSNAKKDTAMSGGIVVRSVVFDELVSDFIRKNPDCTVVNIACGLDTRFYRMDNGKITWYNLDLPETIEVRDSIYQNPAMFPRLRVPCSTRHGPIR